MTLDEAIKRVMEIKDGKRYVFLPNSQDALELGIEALARVQRQRKDLYWPEIELLPGETKE